MPRRAMHFVLLRRAPSLSRILTPKCPGFNNAVRRAKHVHPRLIDDATPNAAAPSFVEFVGAEAAGHQVPDALPNDCKFLCKWAPFHMLPRSDARVVFAEVVDDTRCMSNNPRND